MVKKLISGLGFRRGSIQPPISEVLRSIRRSIHNNQRGNINKKKATNMPNLNKIVDFSI